MHSEWGERGCDKARNANVMNRFNDSRGKTCKTLKHHPLPQLPILHFQIRKNCARIHEHGKRLCWPFPVLVRRSSLVFCSSVSLVSAHFCRIKFNRVYNLQLLRFSSACLKLIVGSPPADMQTLCRRHCMRCVRRHLPFQAHRDEPNFALKL